MSEVKLLLNFLLCMTFTTAIASDSAQHDAVVNEFFHLYHATAGSIGVQTQDGRFGATTFDVDADPAALCKLFISVAPDINYVIVTKPNGKYSYRACD